MFRVNWNYKQIIIIIKVTHTNINKNGCDEQDKSNGTSFAKTHNHEKKWYCCGSGTYVWNNCDIKDMIARDQWFDSTVYVHSHCQKSSYKEDEKNQ